MKDRAGSKEQHMTSRIATSAAFFLAMTTLAQSHSNEGTLHFLTQPDHALGLLAVVAVLGSLLLRMVGRTQG
jgi:hypothetical protein